MVCININESKVYFYNENGVLAQRIDFKQIIKKYGEIQCTSPDG